MEQLIDAIGEVRFGDECGEAIKAAEQASNLLYADQKSQVKNYDVLTEARTKYDAFWYLLVPSKDIKKIVAYVEEVEFYDETTWENPNSDSLYSKYNGKILDENDENIIKRS